MEVRARLLGPGIHCTRSMERVMRDRWWKQDGPMFYGVLMWLSVASELWLQDLQYIALYIYIYEYMYVYIYIYHIILYRIGGWLFCETNLMAAETFMSTSDLSPESLNPESLGAVPQIRRAFFGPPYMMLASG